MVKLDCDIWLPILSYIIGGFVGSFGMIMMYTPQKHSKLFIWFGFAALNIGFILAAIPLQRIIPLHIFLAFCFTFFNIYFLFGTSVRTTMCLTCYYAFMGIAGELGCMVCLTYLLGTRMYQGLDNNIKFSVGITFSNMFLLAMMMLSSMVFKLLRNKKDVLDIIPYCLFPIYQFILFFICLNILSQLSLQTAVIGNLFLALDLIIDVILFFSMEHLKEKKKAAENLSQLHDRRNDEYHYFYHIQKQLEKQRFMKHEYANQLQTLYALQQTGASSDMLDSFIASVLCSAEEKGESSSDTI